MKKVFEILLEDPKRELKIKDLKMLKDVKLTTEQYLNFTGREWWKDRYYPKDFNIDMIKAVLNTKDTEFISQLDNHISLCDGDCAFTPNQYILLITHTNLLKDVKKILRYNKTCTVPHVKRLINVIFECKLDIKVYISHDSKNKNHYFPDFEYELLLVRNTPEYLTELPRVHPCHQMIIHNPHWCRVIGSTATTSMNDKWCNPDLKFSYS